MIKDDGYMVGWYEAWLIREGRLYQMLVQSGSEVVITRSHVQMQE